MKHRFVVFLSLTVLLAAGFLYAVVKAETGSTRLVILPENVTGDPKAAEGLVVSFDIFTEIGIENNPYEDIHPEAEFDTGVYRSEVTYRADGPVLQYEIIPGNRDYREELSHYLDEKRIYEYTRMGMYGLESGRYHFGLIYNLLHGTLIKKWEEAGKPRILALSDYMDYYPMVEEVYPPGWELRVGFSSHGYASLTEQDSIQDKTISPFEAAMALRELKDFFRIPVLKGEQWIMTENTYNPDPLGTEHFEPKFINTNNDRNIFVTFCSLAENGQPVDTSLIPGGYGIYILPYVSSKENGGRKSYIKTEGLRLFSPLDPNTDVRKLGMSLDGKTLYVIYIKNGEYFVRIIDAETAEVYTDVSLGEDNRTYDSDFNEILFPFEDYFAVWMNPGVVENRRLFVLGRKDDGHMGMVMDIPFTEGIYPSALSFDGTRLAVASTDYYTVQVVVYSKDGLLYQGFFEHSMYVERLDYSYGGSVQRLSIRWSK
ncbi:MAG: hypothetical protein IKW95_06360 [Lachnospiraceae bacterium]|nr:hypothetical protein [Lachnospiraceae bacterium]